MRYFLLLLIVVALNACVAEPDTVIVKSPNEELSVKFEIDKNVDREAFYSLFYKGEEIIKKSKIGLSVKNSIPISKNLKIISVNETKVNDSWQPVHGERSLIVDNYCQAEIKLKEQESPQRIIVLTFRAYNEGVAFKYQIPEQENLSEIEIESELTEFSLTKNAGAWVTYEAQGLYVKIPVNEIKNNCERPLVVELNKNLFIALGEAALVNYSRMRIAYSPDKENTLVASLAGEVTLPLPMHTPWRFIMVANTPGQLLENNSLVQNLNAPCAIDDVSWIKPGKVIRELTLTTQGGKTCVDFAAGHGFQYVEFDAGWYGNEYSDESDATTITVDPKRSKGPLDLHEVIKYGEKKGIGIILYVNGKALEKQLDEILPLYESWGVAGVKYGFVKTGSQEWTSWLHEAIRKAAKHHLMVDVHDRYRPTGYSRTYPNFMTREGIRGDEASPSSEQTLITMFTRTLTGAADNTICYFSSRVTEKMGSHVSQLAKAVCIYSPWQFIFWGDRPPSSLNTKTGIKAEDRTIGNEPELDFFYNVPTVWDETKVLEAAIGEYATIARRSGEKWFIGSINGDAPHTIEIPLSFLMKNQKYDAAIYSDDPRVDTRTHVKIEQITVNTETVLKYKLKAKTGLAIRIEPVK